MRYLIIIVAGYLGLGLGGLLSLRVKQPVEHVRQLLSDADTVCESLNLEVERLDLWGRVDCTNSVSLSTEQVEKLLDK
jgi:hypothetical protein